MTTDDMKTHLNKQIALLCNKIGDDKHSANDGVSFGKLTFYMAIRQVLDDSETKKTSSPQDLGFADAFNDTLQKMGLLQPQETFFTKLKTSPVMKPKPSPVTKPKTSPVTKLKTSVVPREVQS